MKKTRKVKSESQEQQVLVLKLRWHYPNVLFFAIPNGGKRSKGEARRLVLEGVEKGTFDMFIAEPRGKFHGMFLEMKREDEKLTKVSSEQEKKKAQALARQYHAVICYGEKEAIKEIDLYLKIDAV